MYQLYIHDELYQQQAHCMDVCFRLHMHGASGHHLFGLADALHIPKQNSVYVFCGEREILVYGITMVS